MHACGGGSCNLNLLLRRLCKRLEEYSPEGPFGDLTRYYNNVEELLLFTVYNFDKDEEEESNIFKNLYRETPWHAVNLSGLKKMSVVMNVA